MNEHVGQEPVYQHLRAHKETWFTSFMLREKLHCSLGVVQRSLSRLMKRPACIIQKIEVQGQVRQFFYKYREYVWWCSSCEEPYYGDFFEGKIVRCTICEGGLIKYENKNEENEIERDTENEIM